MAQSTDAYIPIEGNVAAKINMNLKFCFLCKTRFDRFCQLY